VIILIILGEEYERAHFMCKITLLGRL
jgi:hypothetical protein